MNRKVIQIKNSGFTLMEAIIALALVVLLGLVAIPGTAALKRSLKSTEMEAGARLLFIAAQNRLTVMRSAGTLEQVDPLADPDLIADGLADWIPIDQMPADYDDNESSWDGQTLCVVVNRSSDGSPAPGKTVTDILIPPGAADPAIRDQYYAIEYNPSNGSVHGVFFSDAYFDYAAVQGTDRTREQLDSITDQPVTGYYGGSADILPDVENVDSSVSDFTLENQERLQIRIEPSPAASYRLTIEDRNEPASYASSTYTFSGSQSEFAEYPNMTLESATGHILITLDRLQTGHHFQELFLPDGGKPAILPGADLRITLTAEETSDGNLMIPSTTTKVVNSLFASRAGDEVFLSSARHLQNLDRNLSNVSGITKATVQTDIDWAFSDAIIFVPISNGTLTDFNGGGNSISNLSIATNGEYSGLFGVFGSAASPGSITGVKLTDPTINGGNADFAGALAGFVSHTVISNSSVFALTSNGNLSAGAATAVGGLVGKSENSSYSYCFAALKTMTVNLAGNSGAGGFAGTSTSDTIEHCYANTTEITVNTSGSNVYSGGFIGRSNSNISFSYACGNIKQTNGTAVTGFTYAPSGNISNCYSATTFDGTTGSSYGFSNRADGGCSYFSGSNPTYTSAISGITARSIDELQATYSTGPWRVPTIATTKPYSLDLAGQAYPIALVGTLAHYGNWPIETPGGGLVEIGDTEIFRPDEEIPGGQAMIFKDDEYVFLTADDLTNGQIVVDDVLMGGSLYVPEETGDLIITSNKTVDWVVEGDIVLQTNIYASSNLAVSMVSHNGDIILDGINISGFENKPNPYISSITAENGGIQAIGTTIATKSDGSGVLSLISRDDINISNATITSAGDYGVRIVSSEGSVIASESHIESTGGGSDSTIEIEAAQSLNLDKATIDAKVDITITAGESISARSANIENTAYGKPISITSNGSGIDLSSLATPEAQTSVSSSRDSVYLTSENDIAIVSATISASTGWGMKLQFESTGTDSILWVNNATVSGRERSAYHFTIAGTLSGGTITVFP